MHNKLNVIYWKKKKELNVKNDKILLILHGRAHLLASFVFLSHSKEKFKITYQAYIHAYYLDK